MFIQKNKIKAAALFIVLLVSGSILAKAPVYREISLEEISRYTEDRVTYQQIEYIADPEQHQNFDTSVATLLIIKDKKMYLFKDGYDDHKIVEENKVIQEMENALITNELWEKIIDGKPDFLIITDRRTEVLKRITTDNKSNIDDAYAKYYETIRNKFVQEHVDILRGLMINRKEAEIKIARNPIPKKLSDTGETKFFTSVTAKTKDGMVYYAEDADGNGITETFSVDLPDGFNWGYKSGPNIIFIYNNSQESIKAIISDITRQAVEGTNEEGKIINEEFKTLENDTANLIDDIVRMDDETSKILGKKTWKEKKEENK